MCLGSGGSSETDWRQAPCDSDDASHQGIACTQATRYDAIAVTRQSRKGETDDPVTTRQHLQVNAVSDEVIRKESANFGCRTLGLAASEASVCVDLFCLARNYVDISTLAVLSHVTGGTVYHYDNFTVQHHSQQFLNDLRSGDFS